MPLRNARQPLYLLDAILSCPFKLENTRNFGGCNAKEIKRWHGRGGQYSLELCQTSLVGKNVCAFRQGKLVFFFHSLAENRLAAPWNFPFQHMFHIWIFFSFSRRGRSDFDRLKLWGGGGRCEKLKSICGPNEKSMPLSLMSHSAVTSSCEYPARRFWTEL